MPNARKKKAAKNEDFKKTKLKVGKKKAIPDNFTDTSFKSKSIVLPNQSITEDKSHEITTSRNLTLADLVVQLKHYNAGVKKEALQGLTDLCSSHPRLLVSSLGLVVNGVLKLFVDNDREVRKATLNFLKATFVDLDSVELQPFMSLLVIYTCSAMTHIFEDVRLDAVKLMDLWLQISPSIIVTKFWSRITGNYMSLLTVDGNAIQNTATESTTTTGTATTASIKAAATKSHLHIHKNKLSLLSSLSKFLEAGLSKDHHDPYWFLLNYLDNKHAKQGFQNKMRQYTTANDTMVQWDPKKHNAYMPTHAMVHAVLPSSATFSHLHLFDTSGPKSNGQPNTLETQAEFSLEERLGHIKELIETFQPRLVAAWLEAAPSVFMSTSSIAITPALELLHEILTLSLVLWRAMVGSDIIRLVSQDWLNMYLQQLLKHLTVYFPYGADALGNRGSKVDDKLQEMNIMLCELTSLFLLARTILQPSVTEEPRQKRRKLESEDQVPSWAEAVVQYVLGVLGYHEDQDGMTSASSSFRTDHLVSLLPAIWGFLNCLTNEESVTLFKATVQYYHTCQPNAASRKVLLDFITRAYMVQSTPSYHGQFMITKDSELARLLKEWLLGLPKMLWQLRANHIETSRAILNVMCDIAKRADKDVFDFDTLRQVETTLVPFFFVQLAKGPLFGPFRDLPADVQQRALDYVNYLGSPSEKMSLAIQQCKK